MQVVSHLVSSRATGPAADADRPVNRGVPPPDEAERLRATFGVALRHARLQLGLGIAELAAMSGVSERHVRRVEAGQRRPTDQLCWRLSKALRAGSDDLGVAALAARLGDAAGPSLVQPSRKPHRRRARLVAEARGASGQEVPADIGDSMGGLILAALVKRSTPPS